MVVDPAYLTPCRGTQRWLTQARSRCEESMQQCLGGDHVTEAQKQSSHAGGGSTHARRRIRIYKSVLFAGGRSMDWGYVS